MNNVDYDVEREFESIWGKNAEALGMVSLLDDSNPDKAELLAKVNQNFDALEQLHTHYNLNVNLF